MANLEADFKCNNCGSTLKVLSDTDISIQYVCPHCQKQYQVNKIVANDSMHTETQRVYRAERRKLEAELERKVDRAFTPKDCCGTQKFEVQCDLMVGYTYVCKKCGREQIDEQLKESLDLLYSLRQRFPDDSDRDPIWHLMLIKLLTKNWMEWTAKIQTNIDKVNRSPIDIEDRESANTYLDSFNNFVRRYHHEAFEKLEKQEQKRERKQKKKEYRESPEGRAQAKKKRTAFITVVLIIAIAICTFFTIERFVPQWVYGTNTVEFVVDGKTYTTDAVYKQHYTIKVPQKSGYKFKGLYDAENGGNLVVKEDGTSILPWEKKTKNETLTLYPMWESKEYSFVYNVNGGNNSPHSFNVKYDNHLPSVLEDGITRKGYSFMGWSLTQNDLSTAITDENGNVLNKYGVLNSSVFDISENSIEIFALWKKNSYMVQYSSDGEWSIDKNQETVVYDEITQLSVPTKTGNIFDGWYLPDKSTRITDDCGNLLSAWHIDSDTELIAKWSLRKYAVSFENCFGIDSFEFEYTKQFNLPVPTRYEYDTFLNWVYENSSYEGNSAFTMPAKNVTFRAEWNTNGWSYISTVDEFKSIGSDLSGNYALLSDLDLGNNWTPIGSFSWMHSIQDDNPTNPFTGKLDGRNHTVTYELTIDNLSMDYDYGFGLFGTSNNAEFKNIVLNPKISSYLNSTKEVNGWEIAAGGLVGLAFNSTFSNCSTTSGSSIVNQDTDGTWYQFAFGMHKAGATYTGGLVGDARNCNFTSCTNAAKVVAIGYQAYSGGIVGNAYETSFNGYCSNAGTIDSNHGGWIWGIHQSGQIYGKYGEPWRRSDGGLTSGNDGL